MSLISRETSQTFGDEPAGQLFGPPVMLQLVFEPTPGPTVGESTAVTKMDARLWPVIDEYQTNVPDEIVGLTNVEVGGATSQWKTDVSVSEELALENGEAE